jgi:hypothetical protein
MIYSIWLSLIAAFYSVSINAVMKPGSISATVVWLMEQKTE